MPNLSTLEDTILAAQYKMATLVNTNLNLINAGNLAINQLLISFLNLNILGLGYQINRPDYYSTTTVTIYNRLQDLIGFGNIPTFDNNFQNPKQEIIIVKNAPDPLVITYDDMTLSGTRYDNPQWFSWNPFLIVDNTTWLQVGVDYSLVSSGGFVLNPGGNVPAIYEGQLIRAVAYAAISGFTPPAGEGFPYTFPLILS